MFPANDRTVSVRGRTALVNRVCLVWALGAGTVGCVPRPPAVPVRLEFRLAQSEPAEGLTARPAPRRRDSNQPADAVIYVAEQPLLTNADVSAARMVRTDDGPAIEVQFVPERHEFVRELSEKNPGRLLAIVVDDEVVSAPVIRDRFSASALITGDFTLEEAQRIARGIQAR